MHESTVLGQGYEIGVIRTADEMSALREEWTELHRHVVPHNPFLSWEWTAAHRVHVAPAAVPFVLTARRRDRLVGIAPFRLTRRLGFRVLRFLTEDRSDYLGFLQSADHPGLAGHFLKHLLRLRDHWDLAILRRVCDLELEVPSAAIPSGLRAVEAPGNKAPYLAFAGTWEELCASGPGQLRHTRRWVRRFARDGGTVERLGGPAAVCAVGEIAEVEAASWKAVRGVAQFLDDSGRNLLRQTLASLGARREMEVWLARMKGRPVAFLINFVTPERIGYYQGAYHMDFRRYYPGGVLHWHAIQQAWQDGRREYDFMLGEESYKTGWTNQQRPLRHLALFPDGVRGHLAFGTLVLPRWTLRRYAAAHAAMRWWSRLRTRLSLARGGALARATGLPAGAPADGPGDEP